MFFHMEYRQRRKDAPVRERRRDEMKWLGLMRDGEPAARVAMLDELRCSHNYGKSLVAVVA